MGDPNWGWLGREFEHVQWQGMMFWDTIQPSFMFMVGLAMPFAYAARARRGGQEAVWRHTAYRAIMLIVISNVLMSVSEAGCIFSSSTCWRRSASPISSATSS